jgi:dUTP pyrophosphatase
MDLYAAVPSRMAIAPFHREVIPCGIGIELPPGFEGQVRPRSGLSREGILTVLGTIDSDYRGEIGAVVANFTDIPFIINPGDRVAQLIISPIVQAIPIEVEELENTVRGAAGFGSTGVGNE